MLPAVTVPGADMVRARSAFGCTNVVVTLALLFALLLSVVLAVALALLTAEVPLALATMLIVAAAPEASVPRLQVTVDDPEQDPWLVLAETKGTGKESVITTFAEEPGPLLTTCKT